MRKITSILLGAGILLSLAGCQKGTTSDNEGKLIQFGAKSGAPTRTAYSGQGTTGDDGELTWERIDWVEGDEVLIGSDKAFGRKNGTNRYANYRIYGVQSNGNISTASISDNDGKGLVWGDEPAYTFYGIYPASAGDANIADGSATYSIAATQSPKDGKTDMDQAVMLAMLSGVAPNKTVDLHFYPAYTAFEFVLKAANTDVDLTKVELVSDSDLVGTVTATIAEGTTTNSVGQTIGASTFSTTDAAKVLTYNFPEGTKVTKDTELTFTVFALPVDVVKLKLKFYVNDTDYQSATLKKKVDGVLTDEVTFDACRKHKIYGLAIPDGQWHLYLEADVLDWIEEQKSIQYGEATADGVVVSASALEPITGATSWSRTAATVASDSFVRAYYSVYSPTNGKWRITLKGENAAKFTIATDPAGTTGTNADGEPYIEGDVDGRIIFTLTPNGAASGDSVELWFTVVLNGKEYLLHSEVTRSNSPLTVTVQ
jgi:hypothetical protein